MASRHALDDRARDRGVIVSRDAEPIIMRDDHLVPTTGAANRASPISLHRDHTAARPPALRHRAEWRSAGDAARFTRALADRVRQSLEHEQVLQTIMERLEAGASEAVHRVLHTRVSSVLHGVLHTAPRESAVAAATNLLDDRLVAAVEREVVAALHDRVTAVLRERLDPALGVAIARSGDDVTLDAGAELALQLRRAVELGIRDRLGDGLRHPIRHSVRGPARDRVAETVRFATTEARTDHGPGGDRFDVATIAVVETAVHDSIASGLSERIRAIVTNSVHEALGARLDERLRVPERTDDERFGEHVRPFVAAAVREELSAALRERLDGVAGRAIDDTLRDRLAPAISSAIADQRGCERIDLRRFGGTVRRQLIDALRGRLNDALRTEAMEVLRSGLDVAVQAGVARAARDF